MQQFIQIYLDTLKNIKCEIVDASLFGRKSRKWGKNQV